MWVICVAVYVYIRVLVKSGFHHIYKGENAGEKVQWIKKKNEDLTEYPQGLHNILDSHMYS